MLQASTAGVKISLIQLQEKLLYSFKEKLCVESGGKKKCLEMVESLYFHLWVWIVCRFKIKQSSKSLFPLLLKYLTPGIFFFMNTCVWKCDIFHKRLNDMMFLVYEVDLYLGKIIEISIFGKLKALINATSLDMQSV